VFAHIRAAIGSPVQQTNCHPFRHGRWLWMQNGFLDGYHAMKRDLALAVDPDRFADIEGTTDTEMLFFLALSLGLESDPVAAVSRVVGVVEDAARRHDVEFPVQMTVATTDGETTGAFRYSTEGRSRSLYHSTDVGTLRQQYPNNPALHQLSDDTRLIVSEPLGSLRGAWREVPEATCLVVRGASEELWPFSPVAPQAVAGV
jgi:predicted glutamine amidotransferase